MFRPISLTIAPPSLRHAHNPTPPRARRCSEAPPTPAPHTPRTQNTAAAKEHPTTTENVFVAWAHDSADQRSCLGPCLGRAHGPRVRGGADGGRAVPWGGRGHTFPGGRRARQTQELQAFGMLRCGKDCGTAGRRTLHAPCGQTSCPGPCHPTPSRALGHASARGDCVGDAPRLFPGALPRLLCPPPCNADVECQVLPQGTRLQSNKVRTQSSSATLPWAPFAVTTGDECLAGSIRCRHRN